MCRSFCCCIEFFAENIDCRMKTGMSARTAMNLKVQAKK